MIQCIDMIKTRIVLFLLAALLLTGCTSSESEVSTAVETAENTEADEEGAEVSQDAVRCSDPEPSDTVYT